MVSLTNQHKLALFWLQKISCSLSSMGSIMIISQVLRNPSNRRKPQQRLVMGLSVSDLGSSMNWLLSPLLMPANSGYMWAIGNQATCSMQGFFSTLFVLSAVLYMCSLQLMYLLAIKYGWTETRMRKQAEPYMHAVPWCLGVATAITQLVMKLFNPAMWTCWIAKYPSNCKTSHEVKTGGTELTETDCIRGDNAAMYQWIFFYGPLCLSCVFCIYAMSLIYRSVKLTELKSRRHSFVQFGNESINRRKLSHTQKVKTQCLLYGGSFFVVWTFPTIVRFIPLFDGTPHPVIVVLGGTFIGSQGIFNAIIYFRPMYSKIPKSSRVAKVWSLICMTLLFCCFDERGTNQHTQSKAIEHGHVLNTLSPISSDIAQTPTAHNDDESGDAAESVDERGTINKTDCPL